ncbi:MAG: RHS repeat-associated core domain-containing protein [Saprospiraceae bacterium]|nr:RHS repeat-associated core domain-containing protein [Saprospiraceae bacterium]
MLTSRIALILCFVSFLIIANFISAQPVNNYAKDVSMPAPNAAALGKYGDYSVGNFTGVPDISIPIYTVQEGSLSLPIGISYHASGLKVAEMASWVGAGWALNAGGIITRTVLGIKDEDGAGYFNTATLLETRINNAAGTSSTALAAQEQINSDIYNRVIDGEPDMFSFNVGGYTGKFYIDKNHNAQFIPKQDLMLQIDGALQGFTLIAPDGTRYIFGRVLNADGTTYTNALETTYTQSNTSTPFVTSYYLLRVETADKKYKINLVYDDEGYSYLNSASVSLNYNKQPLTTTQSYDYASTTGVDAFHTTTRSYIAGKKLTKIYATSDTVNFISNNVRADLDIDNLGITGFYSKPAKSLDKIEVKTGDKCQQFDFVYTYFQDLANPTPSNPSVAKKLRLETVTQKSCDGSIINPPYTFTYNGNEIKYRLSKAIDHWGFSNGATSNETNVLNISPTPSVYYGTVGSSNRETNETEMKKGVLTDITFPTGGKTTFTYEANTYAKLQSGPQQSRITTLYSCGSAISNSCCGIITPPVTTTFTPNAEDLLTGKFNLQLTRPVTSTGTPLCNSAYDPTTHVNVYRTGVLVGSLGISLNSNSSVPLQTSYGILQQSLTNNNFFTGWKVDSLYTLELVTQSGYATFEIYNEPKVATNILVGGLRVKEIKSTDGVSTANDIVKQYDYSAPSTPGYSSGLLLRYPKYIYESGGSFGLNSASGCAIGSGELTIFMDESIVPLYNFEGNHIGYNNVKETQNGNGTKTYNFYIGIPYDNSTYPVIPLDPTVSNGQVKDLIFTSQIGTVLKTTNNQIYPETPTYSVGKIRRIIRHYFQVDPASGSCGSSVAWASFYADYQIKTFPYRLQSVKETVDNMPTTTTYTYSTNTTQPLFPLTTSMQNSDGKTTVTTNKYITHTDYDADPVAVKLRQLNIIANPIEVTSTVGSIQVNGARTQYSFFDNTTGLPTTSATSSFPYPYQFYKYKMTWNAAGATQVFSSNSGWEKEGTITKYDMSKGKPLSINLRAWENATASGATESYTWETNGLIKIRQFKGFTWTYDYFPNTKLVQKITDKDGQFVTYTYDHLLRLKQAVARNGAVTTDYAYKYKDAAQSDKSWVETKTTFTSVIGGLLSNNTTYKTVRQYLDGLGRPVQNVAVANSPNLKDVISVIEYDNQGREFKKYDPFESANSNGAFVATLPINQPFSKMEYEASPLSRIWKTTPPSWQPTITEYGTNATYEVYDNTGNGYYAANTLNKVTKTDPDGRVSKVYTDRKGRKVFTVNVQNNVSGGYYMIYSFDDKDRLNKVYTPRGAWQEWWYTNDLDYSYLYDYNDNMIQKKLPDIAAVNMIYNAKNQLVLMQDGKQAALGQYLATQYDTYGRPAATGFANSTSLDIALNPYFTTTLTATDYSTAAGTTLGKPIRTYNYLGTYLESFLQYDSYGRLSNTYSNNQLYSPSGTISATNFSEKIALTYDLADNILTKTRTHKPNATTTRTIVETMDYDNGLRLKRMKHKIDALQEQVLDSLAYTIKNQVQTKWMGKAGNLNYLQKVDYSYNSLGWLTGINNPVPTFGLTRALSACYYPVSYNPSTTDLDYNDLFSMDLKYENPLQVNAPSGTTVVPQYGGNISQVVWQVRGRDRQAYTLQYDAVNRMTSATYSDISATGTVTGNRYDEKLTYDIRGNINTLQRWGLNGSCTWGMIDNLTYNYGSSGYNIKNKLNSVTDNSDLTRGFKTIANGSAYTYDVNGNVTSDPNKGISNIVYNHMDLPTTITFSGGNSINYLYDAEGNKLRKTVSGATNYIQNYVRGIEYKDGDLQAIYHIEGRVFTFNGGPLTYEYALKDHLGNTRLMFSDKNNDGYITQSTGQEANEITQENHYYPFGLNMEGTWQNTPSVLDNKYTYNGKEWNDDFGLNVSDYGFRSYDPAIGRWYVPEPLTDFHPSITPYNYCFNNPINFIDPLGLDTVKGGAGKGEVPNWDNFNPDKDVVELPEATVTDSKSESKNDEKKEEPASGVSENSLARYVPVVGSSLDAYDAFSRGDYLKGAGHTLLAVSDVFLVKAVFTGIGKAVIRKGLMDGTKHYLGVGMSHTYGATTKRLAKVGLDMSGYKHHWLISQALMKKYPSLLKYGNQSWNLTKFSSQSAHMRWAHGTKYGLDPKIIGWELMYPFSSTPEWLKFGIYPKILGHYMADDDNDDEP